MQQRDDQRPSTGQGQVASGEPAHRSAVTPAVIEAAMRLAAIVEGSDDAIISEDLDNIVTSWNRGAEKVFGYSAEEMLGASIMRIIPEELHEQTREVLRRIGRGESVNHESLRRTRSGAMICVAVTASPIKDLSGRTVGVSRIARDITAFKEHERENARLSRLYAALGDINQAIVRTRTRGELFESICRALVEQGGFHMSWVGWHDEATNKLVSAAQWGDTTSYLSGLEVSVDDVPMGRGPAGTAFRERRDVVCNDMLGEAALSPWRTGALQGGFRACGAFPVFLGDEVRGTLNIYSDEAGFFRDKEVALLAEAARDISFALDNIARDEARHRAEQTLREERDFSNAVLNSLPGVLYVYDEDRRFLRWNKTFEQVSGYTSEEVARMHPLDVFAGPDKERVGAKIDEVFLAGQSSVEAGFVFKDGRVIPYHFTGVLSHIDGKPCLVGVGIDVAERRRVEEARWASEARYRTLFNHAPDGIVIADPESFYIDANASICRLLGYTREELLGLHASDIVVPAELAQIEPALSAIAARGDYSREWQFRRKNGSVFPAEVIATTMPDGNLLGMIRDVTERKEAERALRALNETLEDQVALRTGELSEALVRAEAADRIKSAFLATMSHELRTPLNSIIGFTGLLLQGLPGPLTKEQAKQLSMVRGSAKHLLELINDVLDISKIEANQLEVRAEPFDLPASLERVTASVKPQAEKKGLALSVTVSPALGEMVSDRRRVEQILLNLLNNAMKFTERGSVAVTANLIERCAKPPFGAPYRALSLAVADTGMGLKSEDLATLFQPFRQIDTGLARQHEGTGLGLAICRRLANLLGGEITATSEWSRGSTFTVVLPIVSQAKP